jgi:hypothetical protein
MRGCKDRSEIPDGGAGADARHWIEATRTTDTPGWRSTSPTPGARSTIWSGIRSWACVSPAFRRQAGDQLLQDCGDAALRRPLDLRTRLDHKIDWSSLTATLADNQGILEAMIAPIYAYLNTTTAHVPPDLASPDNIRRIGMHARLGRRRPSSKCWTIGRCGNAARAR